MKRIIFSLLAIIISSNLFSQSSQTRNGENGNRILKGCTPHIYIDTTQIPLCTIYDISLRQGDSLHAWCNWGWADALLIKNYDTLYAGAINSLWSFYIVDTGAYSLSLQWGDDIICPRSWCGEAINVQYTVSTFTNEILDADPIRIFPSISTGVFKIKSVDINIKQICISNYSDQLVLSSFTDLSEFDLSGCSPGIYFYAITDEKENVFRGRIVKE